MFDVAKDLCDVLISHQVADETSADFGGILCPLCGKVHVRAGEAVFPLCYLYSETKERKYIESAVRLMKWLLEAQQENGCWGNDAGDFPELATVLLTTALCHAHRLVASELKAEEIGMLEKMIRKVAEYVYRNASFQWAEGAGPGINCLAASCPALQLAYAITGEEKYRHRAKENALSVVSQINEEGFLVGEGPRGSGSRLAAIDAGFSLEIGLGSLVVYSCLSGNEEVREGALKALETHLNFITPSGYIDDSWGTRMYEWTLLGNEEGNGCQVAFLPLRNFDARFQRAAGQNVRFMVKKMMKDGLVTTGPHEKDNADLVHGPCIKPTAARANAVCQALVYCRGVPLSREGKTILPTEEKGWVRLYRTVNVLQVRTSALLCTITGYGGSEGEGTPIVPTGGTISHLWNSRFGTVQAASSCMVGIQDDDLRFRNGWLTPRIEVEIDGEVFSNVFERNATISPSGDSVTNDRFEVSVRGRLKSGGGEDSGLGYAITYRFEGGTISKEIVAEGSREAKLRSVEPIVFARGCDLLKPENGVEIRHPRGSSCILSASGGDARIREVRRKDVVWSPVPALYALPIVIEAGEGADPRKISYTIELRDWE